MKSPKGTRAIDGEHATLEFRRVYRHAIERVWDAITTPEGLREWLLCTHALVEPRVGGRIETVGGPAQYRSTGHVLAWEPPHVFEYEWNVAPVPEMPRGEQLIFRYELAPDGDATRMLVTIRRLTLNTSRGFLPGMHAYLDRLEAQLDGTDLPDFLAHFAALRADYPEWSDASHAGQ
ncbi:MAG TPA: SRPBCC family protein [Kofleriaceae bacterium]|jgi:uncharacterized protein YndB with AHSA1/START domain